MATKGIPYSSLPPLQGLYLGLLFQAHSIIAFFFRFLCGTVLLTTEK